MERLLKRKELAQELGIPVTTLQTWLDDFSVFVPYVQQGARRYYRTDAIEVLTAIKTLRSANHSKVRIIQLLSERGYPITVEDAVQDIEDAISGHDPRDTLLRVMQTMSQAIQEQVRQADQIKQINERSDDIEDRVSRIEQLLAVTQQELETERTKTIWQRLFGGGR